MRTRKEVLIAGVKYRRKSDVTNHFSKILNGAVDRDLDSLEFKQVHELFQWHPDFLTKTNGQSVKRIFVARGPRQHADGHSTITVFKFETSDRRIDDFSMSKCIDALWAAAEHGADA